MLRGKIILIGVSGGIAAYKIADLVSRLKKLEAEVHVVMTRAATEFITPLTLAVLSQNPVAVEMFEDTTRPDIQHIELAQKADLVLIAPATANVIGKIAHGIADDLLTTMVMASTTKVALAPSMNVHMYENPILQENLNRLRSLGYQVLEPGAGFLACGDTGRGRLPEPEELVDHIIKSVKAEKDFQGVRVLVTAGGTREPIDPIRYISNRSTGKMGYAIAEAAAERGASVVLVSAPAQLTPPPGVEVIRVTSAGDMHQAVMQRFNECDVVIKAAAVADYRPRQIADQKIKKMEGGLKIELERTPDILFECGQRKQHQVLVGFAAETENVEEYAKKKIGQKNLDMIVANDVSQDGAGFGTETNIVTIFYPGGKKVEMPRMSKLDVAFGVLDEVGKILSVKRKEPQ
ncbi:MAG: bifunctional phosphopantothenoylcysteine decarboxylase/phosphopantothenate--cysteine ligase CoaBC [Firmicutes bacterium]|nr:bifunctional phosphopantothenoylcysteine decarboxylase/phosphopantothenate--cysteine ligase CoaBC [Bacillota bacterium]